MAASKLQAFWNHPAGPKTIHFWGPTFKWVISIANVADFSKPPENISYPHQCGLHLPPFLVDVSYLLFKKFQFGYNGGVRYLGCCCLLICSRCLHWSYLVTLQLGD
ncbi:hypothetical protein EUGRSUZ_F03502 [Eucalyptus grandis]|uniref:Mitochondrial pyruvate carrier n=3 Tax=Eucalyptus grandis TaxID=71139 RepID=A0A059BW92_EUCGR|nr:hypothetical protein EUGRSUZ_F03502 [Eucalyptus grandis]KAK3427230.1 hypothetical protein EUGRSUZ_F03502 [Eucalyptus grandis]